MHGGALARRPFCDLPVETNQIRAASEVSVTLPDALPEPVGPVRRCPDGAALTIRGETYPCDAMDMLHESSDTHEGWAHSNAQVEAIWR